MALSISRAAAPLLGWVAGVLVILAAAEAAAAPTAAAEAERAAEAKLVEGVGLLKDRRYGEALQRFQEAYALVPSPRIAYDFGLAYLGLEDSPRALESFETFLDARDAPADKRRKAERYRDELRGRVAILDLAADVAAAELIVDGKSLGRLSLPRRLYFEPGVHEMVARGAAGTTQATSLSCLAGRTANLALRLAPPPAPSPTPALPAPAASTAAPLALAPAAGLEPAQPNTLQALQQPPPAPRARYTGPVALSVAALGVVSIGAGVAFGVMARNDGDMLTDDSRNRRDFVPDTEASGLRNQRLETVFLSVGVAAVVAGAGLYALARHLEASAAHRGAP